MAFLDSIAAYLQDNGIGTVGTDLFKASMPDVPDAAVCVYEYAGGFPEQAMDSRLYVRPGLQVVARGDYQSARAKIESIFALIDRLANVSVNGLFVVSALAIQSPFPLGIDANGRHKIAVNFQVEHRI